MRIELQLSGADQIKSAFRSMSDELDKLNKKIDAAASSLKGLSVSGGSVSSASGSASVTPPPVVPPPINPAGGLSKSVNIASSLPRQGANVANMILGMLPIEARIAATAILALGAAAMEASKAITAYADYSFIARGSTSDKSGLAGISRAAGVGLDEAGRLAGSRPGGAAQLKAEIETMRNMPDEESASRYAQMRGIEGYRKVRNMTDAQYQNAQNPNTVSSGSQGLNDKMVSAFDNALSNVTVDLEKLLIPVITNLSVVMTGLLTVTDYLLKPFAELADAVGSFVNDLLGGNKGDTAADKQIKAAQMNQDSANKISDAVYGGGGRTKGAIPAAWGWATQNGATANQISKLGGII